MLRRLIVGSARLLGLRAVPLGARTWLVSRGREPGVRPIGSESWIVERGRPRRLTRIGEPALRTHLLVDRRRSRGDMQRIQQDLSSWLLVEQVAWVLRELDVNCVFDVGANVGQYAKSLRRAGYTGRIVSFEPLADLVVKLRSEAAQDPQWHVFDCGLGDENTEAQINVTPGTMSSMLESSQFGKQWSARLRDMQSETIRIRRLDALFDEATAGIDEPRVYLKMDTQGYDLQTFRGAGDRLAEVLAMQSEASCLPIYEGMPRLPEQIIEYEAAGFEIAGMFSVTRHRETLRIIEFDVVLVRGDAVREAGLARAKARAAKA